MLDRSDLLHFTLHTVLHNLTEGMILVSIILFLFLLNVRAALNVSLTIPFSLLFASIWLNVSQIPANLLSLGALDFGMVVDGTVVMVENIMRHLSRARLQTLAGPPPTASEMIREACQPADERSVTPPGPIFRSSRCSAWRAGCSGRWPGRWPSLFSAP